MSAAGVLMVIPTLIFVWFAQGLLAKGLVTDMMQGATRSDEETRLDALLDIKDISRPPRALVEALARVGTATLSSELNRRLGMRDPQIRGPRRW